MSKKRTFSPEQITASDPTQNVWVQANAGTGKTSVLIQRLLRILFRAADYKGFQRPGDDGILCLTYTNTGAAEMRNRILSALREWAYVSDDDLRDLLHGISHKTPATDDDLARARDIFYQYIDNPNMLKIRTIHSFCEEILRRFPIEANVSPSWQLVSGPEQKRLLKDTFRILLNSPTEFERLTDAFSRVADQISEHSLDDLLSVLTGQYRYFFKLKNNINYREQFINNTKQLLKVSNTSHIAFYENSAYANRIAIPGIIDADARPAGYLLKISETIRKLFKNPNTRLSDSEFNEYKSAFLTAANTRNSNVSRKDYLTAEQDLVYNLTQENLNRETFENTIALFDLTDAFAQKYREIKQLRGLMDFDDLILHTNDLFADESKMGWVLSQLDSNLHHILVDEAQDTSPEQWDILKSMTTNFFTDGDYDNPRSMFVVGDTKQSIFSFQGADPAIFETSKTNIGRQIENDMRKISDVPLAQSFRSASAILSSVDFFFNDVSISCLTKFINNSHKVFRVGDAGLVEIHPILRPGENENTSMARQKYISNLADKIQHLIQNETIESASRPIRPSDIMVLVQRRNPFVAPLIAELQSRDIPVAGSDRIFLPDFPAIRDMMNLVRFAYDVTDDYMLACVLKSPLFRFDEDELFRVCRDKHKARKTLFEIIADSRPDVHAELSQIIKWAYDLPPYSFFIKLLNSNARREKMLGAMGAQIIDPLEEFLTICLSYERTRPGTLYSFYQWFIDGGAEIKRDIDSSSGVRIMTAHSSKGLDSPIVFLIDTLRNPKTANAAKVAEPISINGEFSTSEQNKGKIDDLRNLGKGGWIWRGRTDPSENFAKIADSKYQMQLAEYYRLLYVAMTRARDRLYIYGFKGGREAGDNSWHEQLYRVMGNHPDATITDGVIKIYHPQVRDVKNAENTPPAKPPQNTRIKKYLDDNLFNACDAASPLLCEDEGAAYSAKIQPNLSEFLSGRASAKFATDAGTDMHKRLQRIVIDTDAEQGDSELIAKIKSVPGLALLFAADARTEIPIAGTVQIGNSKKTALMACNTAPRGSLRNGNDTGQIENECPRKTVSRRIDRMIVRDDKVIFVDYKTDVDKNQNRVAYIAQINEYAKLLHGVYPDKKIIGYILWTCDWQLEQVI